MTGSPRHDGGEPNRPVGGGYPGQPGYSGYDPAYAEQSPYGPTYSPPQGPAPTQRLPPYPYGYGPGDPHATGPYGTGPTGDEPPPDGKSPRWLWALAGVAVFLVVALVIALVISNSSRQETVVAPAPGPAMPEPTSTTTRTPTTTTRPTPTPIAPAPTTSAPTPTTTVPGRTESVTYDVSGTGRAISITYTDNGGVPQTEFNVALPWSKQVELTAAEDTARISIINLGSEVTCTVTVDGVTTEQRTGAGLTICAGLG